MPKISCIIPAYNEEKNILSLLQVVSEAKEKSNGSIVEIILINDASTDSTLQIVDSFFHKYQDIKIINNKKNLGKSQTVKVGLDVGVGSHILLLDADLLDLKFENILSLIEPVIKDYADVSISIRRNSPFWMKKIGIDFMSGERVVKKEIIEPHMDKMKKMRSFGLEVFMNKIIIENKLKIKSIYWHNVRNDFKWEKRGFFSGVKKELLMWVDLFSVISPLEFVIQNVKLSRLLIK